MFPEAFKQLAKQGVELVVVPSYWLASDGIEDQAGEDGAYVDHNPDSEALFLNTALTTRAFETTACLVYVNAVGPPSEGYIDCGQVTLPLKGALPAKAVQVGEERPEVVEVEDMAGVLRDAERRYKIRMDMESEGWHY